MLHDHGNRESRLPAIFCRQRDRGQPSRLILAGAWYLSAALTVPCSSQLEGLAPGSHSPTRPPVCYGLRPRRPFLPLRLAGSPCPPQSTTLSLGYLTTPTPAEQRNLN